MVVWLEGRIVLYAVGSIDERDVCRSHLSRSGAVITVANRAFYVCKRGLLGRAMMG